MRTCTGCKQVLDESHFYTTRNGYTNPRCKECIAQQKREWVKHNREHVRQLQKKHNEANKDKIKANALRWHHNKKNHARILERMREYAKRCYEARKARENKS